MSYQFCHISVSGFFFLLLIVISYPPLKLDLFDTCFWCTYLSKEIKITVRKCNYMYMSYILSNCLKICLSFCCQWEMILRAVDFIGK